MKNYFKFLLIFTFFGLLSIKDVSALQNLDYLSNLTISEKGMFYDYTSNTAFSQVGYNIEYGNSRGTNIYHANNTSSVQALYGSYGVGITQCGLSFKQNGYYSVSFYFTIDDYYNYEISPSFSSKSYKLGISTGLTGATSFNYDAVDYAQKTFVNNGYVILGYYTVIFKAPTTGTCLVSAFNTYPTITFSTGFPINYVGYTYEYLGDKALTTDEIQSALNSSFNSINSAIDKSNQDIKDNIDKATDEINDSINESTDKINSNIDELKEKQDEQNETSKGIWATLRDGLSNIGNWFADLSSSIGNFFSDLGDSIGGFFSNLFDTLNTVFFGEEVTTCTTYTNYFTGFTRYYSEYNKTFYDNTNKPLDSNGVFKWSSTDYNTYFMPVRDDFKPNTTYRIFLEVLTYEYSYWTPTGYDYREFNFGRGHNVSNVSTQYTSNVSIRVTKTGLYTVDFTTLSTIDYDADYFMGLYTHVDGAVYAGTYRLVITDDLSMTVDNYEYFTGTRENCEVTGSSGGLFGMLGDMISSIGKWFADLSDSIGNWFKELLTGILDGIKALFVPTDNQLNEIIDDSSKLTENFGFVGESVDFFLQIFTGLLGLSNSNGCIDFPEFSIGETSLFDKLTFWNEQTVCLSDNPILSSNITTIRLITSIGLVVLFINFASSKFFKILSKNDNQS